ncbi:endo-polygalacturonase PG1 [Crassisporium funariophilum]|nr:endo-polygalacturonase PG1 [Crassisporium funariophilum]
MFVLASSLILGCSLAIGATAACVGTVNSLDDVANAVKCTTVNLNSFTVPPGQALTLNLVTGTTVNMYGDIFFGNLSWAGPLFTVSGKSVTFNGNGHAFDGGGPFYWDGLGGNGGVLKPAPMMKIKISGTYSNVKVINSPSRVYSVSNPAPLVMSDLVIDNSQGDVPNAQSNGLAAGHNTDGFDCSTTDLTIQNSVIHNQDDCLAINKGSNIVFTGNSCTNGHGISIGSIDSDVIVSGIIISNNLIINNDQALRIKTKAASTNSSVTNVTYSGNTATGIRQFGVIIDQSYPDTLKIPGNGVQVSGINFVAPMSTLSVVGGAEKVAVNCGVGSCSGTWDWSYLKVYGGSAGPINNFTGIAGFRQYDSFSSLYSQIGISSGH